MLLHLLSTAHGHALRPRRRCISPGIAVLLAIGLFGATVAFASGQQNVPATHSVVEPGYLGVSLRDLDSAEASRLHLHGAMIVTVDRDAPAWSAGLRPRDIVTDLNGTGVDCVETLRKRLRQYGAGQTITLRIYHTGTDATISIMLADENDIGQDFLHHRIAGDDSGEDPPAAKPDTGARSGPRVKTEHLLDDLLPGSIYTGLQVEPLTPQLAQFFGVGGKGRGLLVTSVDAGSPGAFAGLSAGDVILTVGRESVTSHSNLQHALRDASGETIPMQVVRNRRTLTVPFPAKSRKK